MKTRYVLLALSAIVLAALPTEASQKFYTRRFQTLYQCYAWEQRTFDPLVSWEVSYDARGRENGVNCTFRQFQLPVPNDRY